MKKFLTLKTFIVGMLAGIAAGIYTPDDYEVPVGQSSLNTFGSTTIISMAWSYSSKVPGSAALVWIFIAGFNVGYFATEGVEWAVEKFN